MLSPRLLCYLYPNILVYCATADALLSAVQISLSCLKASNLYPLFEYTSQFAKCSFHPCSPTDAAAPGQPQCILNSSPSDYPHPGFNITWSGNKLATPLRSFTFVHLFGQLFPPVPKGAPKNKGHCSGGNFAARHKEEPQTLPGPPQVQGAWKPQSKHWPAAICSSG